MHLNNKIRLEVWEIIWEAMDQLCWFAQDWGGLCWVTLTAKMGTVSGKPGWLLTIVECDFSGTI